MHFIIEFCGKKLISGILCHGTFEINHCQPWFILNVPWQRMQLISFYKIRCVPYKVPSKKGATMVHLFLYYTPIYYIVSQNNNDRNNNYSSIGSTRNFQG